MPLRSSLVLTSTADGAGPAQPLANPGVYNFQLLATAFGGSSVFTLQSATVDEEDAYKDVIDPYTGEVISISGNSKIYVTRGGVYFRLFATSFSGSSGVVGKFTLASK